MYLFKQDTLRDGVIDAKESEQWKQILNEYEESLKEIISPKNEEKIDLKKIQEQINYYNRRTKRTDRRSCNKYKSSTIERTGIYALWM